MPMSSGARPGGAVARCVGGRRRPGRRRRAPASTEGTGSWGPAATARQPFEVSQATLCPVGAGGGTGGAAAERRGSLPPPRVQAGTSRTTAIAPPAECRIRVSDGPVAVGDLAEHGDQQAGVAATR